MMKVDIDKVIILENKEEYVVLDKTTDKDIDYYYIAKINSAKTDIDNNYKLITIEDTIEGSVIKEVTGEERLKEILPLFEKTY